MQLFTVQFKMSINNN